MAFELIETVNLTSSASSITLSSIPQTYTDLIVVLSLRSDYASTTEVLNISLNGGGTFDGQLLRGDGVSVVATAYTSAAIGYITAANNTSDIFSNISIRIPNYTTASATVMSADSVFEDNATNARQAILSLEETTAAAITSLGFAPNTGPNFVTGSTVSLYGIS